MERAWSSRGYTPPKMDHPAKAVWLSALRGEVGRDGKAYAQAVAELVSEDGQNHCCLGVLTDLGEESHTNRPRWSDEGYPPASVRLATGLDLSVSKFLAVQNDGGAFMGQFQCDGLADATARATDQGHLAGKFWHDLSPGPGVCSGRRRGAGRPWHGGSRLRTEW